MELTRTIKIEREPNSDLGEDVEPIELTLNEGELITVKQIRLRFSDEMKITSDMAALVNGETVDESTVLEDGDLVYFKTSSKSRG